MQISCIWFFWTGMSHVFKVLNRQCPKLPPKLRLIVSNRWFKEILGEAIFTLYLSNVLNMDEWWVILNLFWHRRCRIYNENIFQFPISSYKDTFLMTIEWNTVVSFPLLMNCMIMQFNWEKCLYVYSFCRAVHVRENIIGEWSSNFSQEILPLALTLKEKRYKSILRADHGLLPVIFHLMGTAN